MSEYVVPNGFLSTLKQMTLNDLEQPFCVKYCFFRVELFCVDVLVLRHDCFKIDKDALILTAAKM